MGQGLVDLDILVQALIQDGAGKLATTARYEAIRDAVGEHAHLVPFTRRRYVYGTGSSIVATPTGWVDDFSAVARIEYPVGDVPPSYLDQHDYWLLGSPTASTTYQIQFASLSLATSQRVMLEWTIPHTINETGSTLPEPQVRPVSWLAASYALIRLAAFYNQSGDPTIAIDSQNPGSKARDYLTLAKELRNRYRLWYGLGPEGQASDVRAAGIFVGHHVKPWYRSGWFGHPARGR